MDLICYSMLDITLVKTEIRSIRKRIKKTTKKLDGKLEKWSRQATENEQTKEENWKKMEVALVHAVSVSIPLDGVAKLSRALSKTSRSQIQRVENIQHGSTWIS